MVSQGRSIKRSLFLMLLSVSSAVLLMSGGLFFMYQYVLFKQVVYDNLAVQSRIVSDHSQATVLFNDEHEAVRLLKALQYDSTIIQAVIISTEDRQPQILARYLKENSPYKFIEPNYKRLLKEHTYINETAFFIEQCVAIKSNGQRVGYVVLYSDFSQFYRRLVVAGCIILGVIFVGFLLALLLSYLFCERLSKPLIKLMLFIGQVANSKNYNIQYKDTSFYEINQLGGAFNHFLVNMWVAINEREEARTKLLHHNEDLTEQVLSRTKELELAKQRAEASSAAKSAFLANMSHEVRTPMNAILGFSKVIKGELTSPYHQQQLEYVIHSADLLMALMNDMLDFSSIDANKIQLDYQPFNILIELDRIYNMVLNKAQDKELRLLFELAPDVPHMLIGDRFRLNQVVLNLLTNAIKFTSTGYVMLIVERREFTGEGCEVQFSVQDTGIGIAVDQQVNLFEPFTQVDASITREYGGAGLGLSICDKLVTLMGGKLTLNSELDHGSQFNFRLFFKSKDEVLISKPVKTLKGDFLMLEPVTRYATYFQCLFRPLAIVLCVHDNIRSFLEAIKSGNYTHIIIGDMRLYQQCLKQGLVNVFAGQHVKLTVLGVNEHDINNYSFQFKVLNQPVLDSSVLADCFSAGGIKALDNHLTCLSEGHISLDKDSTLLIVDDVLINRELIIALLSERIDTILEASNGKEVIDILKHQSVDLVFMDIQMPVMDGYHTTYMIRNTLQNDVPIIGMTAFVSESDKQLCLSVGMNDVLVKPIDFEKLEGILLQYLYSEKNRVLAKYDDNNLLKIKGIDVASGVECFSDKKQYYDLLLLFYEQYVHCGEEFFLYIQDEEWKSAGALIHKIKGVTANLRMSELSHLCEELNNELIGEGLSHEKLKDFLALFEEVMSSLKVFKSQKIREKESIIERDDVDLSVIERLLQQLLIETKMQSFKCTHLIIELNKISIGYYLEPLTELTKMVQNFEFQQATEVIEDWLQKMSVESEIQ